MAAAPKAASGSACASAAGPKAPRNRKNSVAMPTDHNMAHAHDLLPPQSLIFADLIYE
jgi:hypothetical protein